MLPPAMHLFAHTQWWSLSSKHTSHRSQCTTEEFAILLHLEQILGEVQCYKVSSRYVIDFDWLMTPGFLTIRLQRIVMYVYFRST